MFGKEERIDSFTKITLRESGMRGTWEYEVISKGDEAEVTLYVHRYVDSERRREAEETHTCSKDEIVELLNQTGVMKWDGFHGKHPKHVLDGIMFGFTAEVNDGKTIHADGSQNFPNGYHDFERRISEIARGR